MYGIIYKIKNKTNNKIYIGQTTRSLKDRWLQHLNKNSCCTYLRNSIKKYGKENFEVTVIAYCNSLEQMNYREEYYIRLFKSLAPNGYNLTLGGSGIKGKKHSQETKDKISKSKKGCIVPKDRRLRIGKTLLGRKHPEEIGKKRAELLKKSIFVYPINIVFSSIQETYEVLGVSLTSLHKNLNNPDNMNYHHYKFYYLNTINGTKNDILYYDNKSIYILDIIKTYKDKILNINSVEYLKQISILCDTRTKFKKNYPHEYYLARKMNVLNEVCSHMAKNVNTGKKPHNFKWSKETLIQEAKKYKNMSEFRINSESAYVTSKKLGIFNELCKLFQQDII